MSNEQNYIYEGVVYQHYLDYLQASGGLLEYKQSKNKINPKDISVKRPTPPTPKGMKCFDIDGLQVQAVTKKSAIKKAKKLITTNQTKDFH